MLQVDSIWNPGRRHEEQQRSRLQVQVVGLARIADDVTPGLARAAIESVTVLGAFQASPAVRRALSDRIH